MTTDATTRRKLLAAFAGITTALALRPIQSLAKPIPVKVRRVPPTEPDEWSCCGDPISMTITITDGDGNVTHTGEAVLENGWWSMTADV